MERNSFAVTGSLTTSPNKPTAVQKKKKKNKTAAADLMVMISHKNLVVATATLHDAAAYCDCH